MTAIREEELNMVNGGTLSETASDSQILKEKGYMDESYGTKELLAKWLFVYMDIESGWHAAGIDSDVHIFTKNEYSINGEEMTRKEALENIGA